MTLRTQELRIGNYVYAYRIISKVDGILSNTNIRLSTDSGLSGTISPDNIHGITLTPEWLDRFGAKSIPHFTIGNTKFFDIGRNRQLSVSCAGTPNSMVFLQDMEKSASQEPIVIHNYDYEGVLYVHTFMNLYFALTGEELTIKK